MGWESEEGQTVKVTPPTATTSSTKGTEHMVAVGDVRSSRVPRSGTVSDHTHLKMSSEVP